MHFLKPGPLRQTQSDGRTEAIDSHIFKSSKSNVRYRTVKSQLIHCDAHTTRYIKYKFITVVNVKFKVKYNTIFSNAKALSVRA